MLLFSVKKLSRVDLVTSDCYDCADVFGHGYFQRCLCVLLTFCVCAHHCHTVVFRLISGDVDHWCKQPEDGGMSDATWRNVAIPLDADGRLSRCTFYKYPSNLNNTETVFCDEWDYDPEQQSKTIVGRWDLVCHRKPLRLLAQAAYVAGSLVFLSAVGHLADRIGRMPVLLSAVAFFQLTTLAGCFAASYMMYALSRFFDGGCGATVLMISWTLLFEASTHDNRGRDLCAAMSAGVLAAEAWLAVAQQLRLLDWFILQSFMLSPTLLALYAFVAVHESARWYVARKNMVKAEIAMMTAAKVNHFEISTTACMLERIKAAIHSTSTRGMTATKNAAEVKEVQRRALVMFGLSFAVDFTLFSILLLEASEKSGASHWFEWAYISMEAACFAVLYITFMKISTQRLMTASVGALGVMAGVISLIFAAGYKTYAMTLFLVAKPLAFAVIIAINVSVSGMVPTAVRCGTICWFFAFGRLGGVCGVLLSMEGDVGRGDVLFALAATALFAMLHAHLSISRESDRPTLSSPVSNVGSVGYMQQTLDPLSHKKEKKTKRAKSRAGHASSKSHTPEQKPLCSIPE